MNDKKGASKSATSEGLASKQKIDVKKMYTPTEKTQRAPKGHDRA